MEFIYWLLEIIASFWEWIVAAIAFVVARAMWLGKSVLSAFKARSTAPTPGVAKFRVGLSPKKAINAANHQRNQIQAYIGACDELACFKLGAFGASAKMYLHLSPHMLLKIQRFERRKSNFAKAYRKWGELAGRYTDADHEACANMRHLRGERLGDLSGWGSFVWVNKSKIFMAWIRYGFSQSLGRLKRYEQSRWQMGERDIVMLSRASVYRAKVWVAVKDNGRLSWDLFFAELGVINQYRPQFARRGAILNNYAMFFLDKWGIAFLAALSGAELYVKTGNVLPLLCSRVHTNVLSRLGVTPEALTVLGMRAFLSQHGVFPSITLGEDGTSETLFEMWLRIKLYTDLRFRKELKMNVWDLDNLPAPGALGVSVAAHKHHVDPLNWWNREGIVPDEVPAEALAVADRPDGLGR